MNGRPKGREIDISPMRSGGRVLVAFDRISTGPGQHSSQRGGGDLHSPTQAMGDNIHPPLPRPLSTRLSTTFSNTI